MARIENDQTGKFLVRFLKICPTTSDSSIGHQNKKANETENLLITSMDNPLTELNPTSLERIHSASENLYELIENVSLLRLQQLLQSEETTIQNLEEKQPLLPGYWMSLILLAFLPPS